MQIRTSCPTGCKYISGDRCIANECPYQTGSVRYDIRMNTFTPPKTETKKSETEIIKDYLRQQFVEWESVFRKEAKAATLASKNNGDDFDEHRIRAEYASVRSCVVFDMYKDLTGERVDGKPNDYKPDVIFRNGEKE